MMLKTPTKPIISIGNGYMNHVASRGFAAKSIQVVNPLTSALVTTVQCTTPEEFTSKVIPKARGAQKLWSSYSAPKRVEILSKFPEFFRSKEKITKIAQDISAQMGKPLGQATGECGGCANRAESLLKIAPKVLENVVIEKSPQFTKEIVCEPKGVIMSMAAWNYPLLTAVNSVVPALAAGNAVVITHGPTTPLTSKAFVDAFKYCVEKSMLPATEKKSLENLIQDFFMDIADLKSVLKTKTNAVDFVSFTGSTSLGKELFGAIAEGVMKPGNLGFVGCTLELGGSDASYVSDVQSDSTWRNAVETVVDGAFYNAGQSCCGVQLAFVHEKVYDKFLKEAVDETKRAYGSEESTGALAKKEFVTKMDMFVKDAVKKGAKVEIGGKITKNGTSFEPTILSGCTKDMLCMQDEVFGPIVCVAKVKDENEAIKKMNDSKYGLTASIFTNSMEQAERMLPQLEAGTVFANRADYLEPLMPWQGRKDTGLGSSLGADGFRGFFNLKNKHFKHIK